MQLTTKYFMIDRASNHKFFLLWVLDLNLCENRQQLTWILVKKVAKRRCTCVCAPHFFYFYIAQLCKLMFKINSCTQHKQKTLKLTVKSTLFFVIFLCWYELCENRQQPTWILRRKGAKDGVHACVVRIFFFFMHNCANWVIFELFCVYFAILSSLLNNLCCFCVFFVIFGE